MMWTRLLRFEKGQAHNPGIWSIHLKLAGALGLKGEIEEARAQAAEMVKLKPDMNSVARIRGYVWYRNPQFQVLHDRTNTRACATPVSPRRSRELVMRILRARPLGIGRQHRQQ